MGQFREPSGMAPLLRPSVRSSFGAPMSRSRRGQFAAGARDERSKMRVGRRTSGEENIPSAVGLAS